MADVTLSGFGDNIYAGSISADRIAYNDAVGFYDPKSVTNPNRLTNGDKLRSMSDEELAEEFIVLLGKFGFGDREELLDWLKSDAKEK